MGGKSSTLLLPQAERKVASRLSAAQSAESQVKRARQEFKRHDPEARSLDKDMNLVANMNAMPDVLGLVESKADQAATPAGAVNKDYRRPVAGAPARRPGAAAQKPKYGVTEYELQALTKVMREGDSGKLVAQFKLKQEDLDLLVHYTAAVVTTTREDLGGADVAQRPF